MIQKLEKRFQSLDRDVNALKYILVVFFLILIARVMWFLLEDLYDYPSSLLAPAISLLAALLVAQTANRLIVNSNIIREDDRRQEIVRTTHHLIAISKDLLARVGYVKAIFSEGGRPALAFSHITATIEDRYETLIDRDAYKFLPGKCVDIITNMSGDIFGISLLAEGVKHITQPIRHLR